MILESLSGGKGTVALATAVVSTLLAVVAFSAMLTDAAPSTLLALVAFSAMLTDLAPSTLLALAALSAMRAWHRWNNNKRYPVPDAASLSQMGPFPIGPEEGLY